MNQLLTQIEDKFKEIKMPNAKYKTNAYLLRAILAIELYHRNIVWRFFEYLAFLTLPYKVSERRILTIGKLQIKVKYLRNMKKRIAIKMSNDVLFLDNLLYKFFPEFCWMNPSREEVDEVVRFYNGDKTGEYSKYIIQKLI